MAKVKEQVKRQSAKGKAAAKSEEQAKRQSAKRKRQSRS
jgi:hypothetical protein